MSAPLRIVGAEVAGVAGVDLRVEDGRIAALGHDLDSRPGEEVLQASGGALLPGLHDHHIHLLACAAADRSARCGPPEVKGAPALAAAFVSEDDAWAAFLGGRPRLGLIGLWG